MGALMAGGRTLRRGTRAAARAAAPVARLAVDPPLLPARWRPIRRLQVWGEQWQSSRDALLRRSVTASTEASAAVAHAVLPLVDLTPVVNGVLERLDLTPVVNGVLERLDLAAVVDQVIVELDVGTVVEAALDEVDLTEVVVGQVDLGRVVTSALDQLDLTQIVLARVALRDVVVAALDTLDLTEIVQQRVDLPLIAEQVVEDIDLPEIIQESTGSVASEAVQGVRLRSVEADERVSRVADRLLFRRRRTLETGVELEGDIDAKDDS